jgi:hypothetical protein
MCLLVIGVSLITPITAQQQSTVDAPYAQALVTRTKADHKEIHKIGIHATPPGSDENVIVAADIASKIGKKSSAKDMEILARGKPACTRVEKDQIYDLLMSFSDNSGKEIGFLVMEIPLADAKNEADALQKGTAIRDEMQKQIRSKDQLFQ